MVLDDLTPEERAAVRALQRVAKRWPASLVLITSTAALDLSVARHPLPDKLGDAPCLARINLRVEHRS